MTKIKETDRAYFRRLVRNMIFDSLTDYGVSRDDLPGDPSDLTLDIVTDLLLEQGATWSLRIVRVEDQP